ncbi:MAG: TIGR01620 family protein [Pseudomonadota bacterium]
MTQNAPGPGPVLIELEETAERATPADAPPIEDAPAQGAAMQSVASLAARPRSRLSRWFWGLLAAVIGFFLSLSAWTALTALLERNPLLGLAASVLLGAFVVVALAIALREVAAFARLGRIDRLSVAAETALTAGDLAGARGVLRDLTRLYRPRPEATWALERIRDREAEMLDADSLLALAERELLSPLDAAALKEVEAAARQVATVTALVPLALADVVAALSANIRMIRRVAEIYGGRSGAFGAWRLTRAVFGHLVATGALAAGDDLIGSIAGGSILSKVSRRFGEGLVNAALTARVGVAAMEVCRPLAFRAAPRPGVTALVRRALTGLFDFKE